MYEDLPYAYYTYYLPAYFLLGNTSRNPCMEGA